MMESEPRASLEVIDAEFLLHLLMRLLAGPTRLEGEIICRCEADAGEIDQ